MTILTTIAITGALLVLAMGVLTLFGGRGYRFDLRRRSSAHDGYRAGGRRRDDRLLRGPG